MPQGLGDSIWALLICKSVAKKFNNTKIDLRIGCWEKNLIEQRALDFLQRFDFVNSTEMYVMPRDGRQGPVLERGPATNSKGYYQYLKDGFTKEYPGIDYILIPNGTLENGISIEHWHKEFAVDFDIMHKNFAFKDEEKKFGDDIKNKFGEYVVFYMSSLAGNTVAGHNRNGLFSPQEWADLGDRIHAELGLPILVVGAQYDSDYYDEMIKPLIKGKRYWHNYIDQLDIFHSLMLIKNARFMTSYQSGLGIVGHYMGTKTAMFWRPYGNSISPYSFVSFDEKMAYCWTRPGTNKEYMPCIYSRHGTKEIMNFVMENKW